MGVPEIGQRRRALDAERGPRRAAQRRAHEGGSIIGEADEPRVERGIPQRREQQPIVHVKSFRVAAFGPRHDMGGAQQGGIGDAGQRPPQ